MARTSRQLRMLLWPALLAAGAWAAAAPALAQDEAADEEATARARALFEEGVTHVDAGEWEQAAEKFRAALELRDAPAVRYNLASALVALGEYTEAESLARALVDDPTTPPDLRDRSQELLDQIGSAAGRLEVEVRGATRGITVRIDGEPAEAARVVHEFSLEPRDYTIVLERNGREIERRQVTVRAGSAEEVVVPVAPTPEETAVAAEGQGPSNGPADGGDDAIVSDWRFWAAVGGAVTLAVILAIVAAN